VSLTSKAILHHLKEFKNVAVMDWPEIQGCARMLMEPCSCVDHQTLYLALRPKESDGGVQTTTHPQAYPNVIRPEPKLLLFLLVLGSEHSIVNQLLDGTITMLKKFRSSPDQCRPTATINMIYEIYCPMRQCGSILCVRGVLVLGLEIRIAHAVLLVCEPLFRSSDVVTKSCSLPGQLI
jgi:hypothetical protein